MSDQITKKSDIVITVGLDANQIPSAIKWSAVDTNVTDAAASAFFTFHLGSKGEKHNENRLMDKGHEH